MRALTIDLPSSRRRTGARRGAVRALVVACSFLWPILTASGALAAQDGALWRPGPGLKITRSPQTAGRPLTWQMRGRTNKRVLARLTVPLKVAPPTTRLVFKVVVTSRTTRPLTCVRLLQGAVNRGGKVIAAAAGPWTCLTPGQSRWLWIEYHPTVDAAVATWLLERRRGEAESIALDLTGTMIHGKGPLLPRVRINDPLPPSPRTAGRRRAPPLPLTYRLKPGLKSVHPRLFFTPQATARYRSLIRGPLSGQFARLKAFIDRKVNETPPPWPPPGANELHPWILAGYRVFLLAGMYRLTGERRYLDAALTWARGVASWPDWGVGEFKNNDLGAAQLLSGLALAYDWLYPEMPAGDRRLIRDKLARQATLMYRAATTPFAAWWNLRWRQNHLWVNYAALGLAGLVLSGEVPAAPNWVRAALAAFNHANVYLPRDGSYHEGVGYWRYAVEHLAVFFMALEGTTDVDPWPSFPWLNRSVRFRLHHMVPTRGGVINFGDTPEIEETSAYPQLYVIARAFKNPVAQWLAREIEYATQHNPEDTGRLWAILGYDPRIKAVPPDGGPTFALFDDLGQFFVRSDWGPDGTLIAFKCGPPGGRRNTWMRINGLGVNLSHSHPDQNSLLIFAHRRPVLVDDGYARSKATRRHNTLLVGGLGQRGEGRRWYHENRPRRSILTRLRPVLATPFISAARGEAAPMYPTTSGLKHFGRLVVFLPPDMILVSDDVTADRPVGLQMLFHFRGRLSRVGSGDRFLLQGQTGGKLLSARFVSPQKLVSRIRPHTRPVFELLQARLVVRNREHATLSLGPAARTTGFQMLSLLKPWTADRRISELKAVTAAGTFGAAFTEAGRRNFFLTRTGPGTMAHGPWRATARTVFVTRDRAGNLVALVLAGRELSLKGDPILRADRPINAALMRRAQVLIVLARSERPAKVTLRTGFQPTRVQVGGRNLPAQPGWSQGRVEIDLAPGRPAVIVALGPRAPALPPALAGDKRREFFLAR